MTSRRVRFTVALVVSAVGIVTLVVVSMFGGDNDPTSGSGTAAVDSTVPAQDSEISPSDEAPTTTVEIPPEWRPKGSSLYSDREPSTTVTVPDVDDPLDADEPAG